MKTDIHAPFWIVEVALPHLKPGSAIIGTTSEQAYGPLPELYDDAQTKAAMMNYVKSPATRLASKGIRVNGVARGPVRTPLQASGGASMEKLEKFGSQAPFGRPGQPVELASVYVQLAAVDASFASGQVYGAAGSRNGYRETNPMVDQLYSTKASRAHTPGNLPPSVGALMLSSIPTIPSERQHPRGLRKS
jgi:NAD(P)-dependent dehydrogenase (short-subunit alcohol dehydrogenase family)